MTVKVTMANGSSDSVDFVNNAGTTLAQVKGIDGGSSNGSLALHTTASGTSTERVRVDNAGNVGVGTSSPATKLQVNGQTRISDGSTNIDLVCASSVGYIGTQTNAPLVLRTNDTERARIATTGQMSTTDVAGNVKPAYDCRAWVNFNGTGTVAIRGSGNVSSITDNGTGDYTVNFTTAMSDTNYATTLGAGDSSGSYFFALLQSTFSTSSVRVMFKTSSGSYFDTTYANAAVFR